jgi:hypothetical protein
MKRLPALLNVVLIGLAVLFVAYLIVQSKKSKEPPLTMDEKWNLFAHATDSNMALKLPKTYRNRPFFTIVMKPQKDILQDSTLLYQMASYRSSMFKDFVLNNTSEYKTLKVTFYGPPEVYNKEFSVDYLMNDTTMNYSDTTKYKDYTSEYKKTHTALEYKIFLCERTLYNNITIDYKSKDNTIICIVKKDTITSKDRQIFKDYGKLLTAYIVPDIKGIKYYEVDWYKPAIALGQQDTLKKRMRFSVDAIKRSLYHK